MNRRSEEREAVDKHVRELQAELKAVVNDGRLHRHMRMRTLIVANMSDEDFDRFHAAHITLSGSTGKGATKGYGDVGPYIATYCTELLLVLDALGWERVDLSVEGETLTMRRRLP